MSDFCCATKITDSRRGCQKTSALHNSRRSGRLDNLTRLKIVATSVAVGQLPCVVDNSTNRTTIGYAWLCQAEICIQYGWMRRTILLFVRKIKIYWHFNKKRVKGEYNKTSLVEATLCTGKTHQLRVHFSSMGHPIIGDELYGAKSNDGILHLHSYYLDFTHPITKEQMTFTTKPKWLD